jgi:CBS-domain-containing membrane protein
VMPLLVGNIVCICMAMIINNLSRKRQYPLWWA